MPEVNCIFCGALVHKFPWQIKRAQTYFCGHACRGAYAKRLRSPATCAHCGTVISEKPAYIKRSRTNFCSRACSSAYHRIDTINPDGYRLIRVNGKQVLEHRWVMEQHLGRPLLPSEDVHHKDLDPSNNSLSNLVLLDKSTHQREHHPLSWDLEHAIALRTEGLSFYKIAKAFGVSGTSLRNTFIRRGLHATQPGLSWDLEAAKAMRAKGLTFKEIGKVLSAHPTAIREAFIRRGLHVPRPRDKLAKSVLHE